MPFALMSAVVTDEVRSRAVIAGTDAVVDKDDLVSELAAGPENSDYLDAA